MKIWKIIFVACLMLLLCYTAAARVTVVTRANELRIDLVRYDPSPVQPGSVTELQFEVINLDDEPLTDLEIILVENYPFMIKTDTSTKFEALEPGEKAKFSYIVEVNPNVVEGTYRLSVQYESDKFGRVKSTPFNIDVLRGGSIMSTSVAVAMEDSALTVIEPGRSANVKFTVINSGNSAMQDVNVKLKLTGEDVPFAPLGMTTEKKIRLIEAGKEADVVFSLIALPDADAGVYKVPIDIKYYDEFGYLYNVTDLIGLVIGSEPKISLEIESTELTTSTKTGNLVLKIVNYGTTDIKFARVKLAESEDYEIISSSETYIGDIDSDDYETAEFRLKMLEKSADINVVLDYRDANNVDYSEEQSITINLYSPGELGIQQSKAWVWIVLILIAVGAYFGYKRYKKAKK